MKGSHKVGAASRWMLRLSIRPNGDDVYRAHAASNWLAGPCSTLDSTRTQPEPNRSLRYVQVVQSVVMKAASVLLGLLSLVQLAAAGGVLAIDYGTEWMKVSLVKPGVPFDVLLNTQVRPVLHFYLV